jgi:hypothetical protein
MGAGIVECDVTLSPGRSNAQAFSPTATTGSTFKPFDAAVSREGDTMTVLDVLARQVGIIGIFSDWAATVTYYANCVGLK